MESAQDAGERLSHGGIFETDVGRNDEHVGFDDAAGDANVFGLGSVVEEEIFAEVLLMLGAVEAHLARGGVEGDDAHALLESVDTGANFLDDSGEFVAEEGRGNDHAGVITALVHLEVGAAGEGNLDLNQNFAITHARDGNFLDL
jgi:hypothetical protein